MFCIKKEPQLLFFYFLVYYSCKQVKLGSIVYLNSYKIPYTTVLSGSIDQDFVIYLYRIILGTPHKISTLLLINQYLEGLAYFFLVEVVTNLLLYFH